MRRELLFLVVAFAAAAPGQPLPGRGGPAALHSPEVLTDRRVVFRLRAPKATEVTLTGDLWLNQTAEKMARGADGVWSVTVGRWRRTFTGTLL